MQYKFRTLLFISLAILVCGAVSPALAQDQVVETNDTVTVTKPVAVENVVHDQAIQKRLDKILESREPSQRYADVLVRVQNGVVTFEGKAQTRQRIDCGSKSWPNRPKAICLLFRHQIDVEAAVNIVGNLEIIQKSLTTLWRDFLARFPLMVAAAVIGVNVDDLGCQSRWLAVAACTCKAPHSRQVAEKTFAINLQRLEFGWLD